MMSSRNACAIVVRLPEVVRNKKSAPGSGALFIFFNYSVYLIIIFV